MNLDSYNAIAEQWEHHRVQLSPLEAQVLPMLTEGLAPNSRVLDLGCGTGQPVAAFFADMGFQIVGVDQSPAMLALAKRRLPAHRWLYESAIRVRLFHHDDAAAATRART